MTLLKVFFKMKKDHIFWGVFYLSLHLVKPLHTSAPNPKSVGARDMIQTADRTNPPPEGPSFRASENLANEKFLLPSESLDCGLI